MSILLNIHNARVLIKQNFFPFDIRLRNKQLRVRPPKYKWSPKHYQNHQFVFEARSDISTVEQQTNQK